MTSPSEIAESVQLVIQLQRYPDGRKVTEVIEVDGYDCDRKVIEYHTIFDRTHEDQDAIFSLPLQYAYFSSQETTTMPLLEITKSHKVTASIALEESTAKSVDSYAAFMKASADDVVNKALEYVFSKDKEFQQFLQSSAEMKAPQPLRIKGSANGMAKASVVGKHLLRTRISHEPEILFDNYTPCFAACFGSPTCSCET